MKLTASLMTTLDGVYQGPGGPDEDRSHGFDRGGWTESHADAEMGPFLVDWFARADALLLGRKTFDIWEPYWPTHADNPIGAAINAVPRYVPSQTRTETAWQGTHFLGGDLETRIRDLKAQPGRELQLHGSGALLRSLLELGLVDELNLRITPVIVGDGMRLFPEHGPALDLELIESRTTSRGVTIQTFRPNGPLTFGNAG